MIILLMAEEEEEEEEEEEADWCRIGDIHSRLP
jgi:hypothetical protein